MKVLRRHQCLIYEGPPTTGVVRLVPLLVQKLLEGNRCMYLGSPTMVARMRYELTLGGVSVSQEENKGSLILSSDQSYLQNGKFDPPRMLLMLREAIDQALKDGYKGLWATGDMTWELGSEDNLPKLLEYECGLEKIFQSTQALSGVCQYHRGTLPSHIMWNALTTHPSVFINHTLQRVNPFYVPEVALLSVAPDPRMPPNIDQILSQLTNPGTVA